MAIREDAKMKENLTKEEWMRKNGFGADGLTWCVLGDTFAIKDQLKEMGCKFSSILKWHSPEPLDVPIGYGMISFSFDEIMKWSDEQNRAFFFEDAREKIEQRFVEAAGPNLSKFIGKLGERIYNKIVIFKSKCGFNGQFGWTYIYTFIDKDNKLIWFTNKDLNFKKGDIINLTGTVIAHIKFHGVKTTRLNRCILKKIGD